MVILCTIDLETRELSLPSGQVIASYDHNVDVIRFQVETIPGFSLDTSSIRIAAQGPNKARHDYAVDPSTVQIEEETGYITFDWPIPQGVTEMPLDAGFKYGDKGNLIFAVCAEIISGSTVSKAWHSDDGIITVVAHLEPESGGGEDPEEEATNRQMIAQLQTSVSVIGTQVAGLAGGTPTVVDSVSDMTDEGLIYILSTDGNWYYYDGTSWTAGGTYGGIPTDTTLSIPGSAADAKAVGDALEDKADADDVTALDDRVTAVEGDIDTLDGRLDDVESEIRIPDEAVYVGPFSQGQINPASGSSSSSAKHCRTSTYTFAESGNYLVTAKDGYAIIFNEYNGIPSGTTFTRCLIDNGTGTVELALSKDLYYRFAVRTVNSDDITPSDLPSDVIKHQLIQSVAGKVEELMSDVAQAESDITALESDTETAISALRNDTQDSISAMQELLLNPVYDHLFVANLGGNNAVIPAESIYHVNISRSLGYKVIECHPQKTSDGHYFVNHLESGAFGRYFVSVNDTDISAVKPGDVTWQWIVDNVRYKTTIPKYATRPTTLEEFLIGCRQNQLIPLMKFQWDDVAEMAERIMGKGNYIVYEGTRDAVGSAVIFRWESSYSTAEDILAFCDSIGKPLIFGSSKFTDTWTEAQSKEIIETLHAHGYMTCVSYEGNDFWRKYRTYGIDFCGGVKTANRLVTGNHVNIENIFNTSDFTVTDGTVTDNVITLEEGGTVTCVNLDNTKKQVAHVDLEVNFDGVLTLTNGLGEFRGSPEFDSADGKLIVCTAVINKPVNFILTATGGSVTIRSIKYKVSLC